MSRHDVPDDADEKWEYPEHTGAKHQILRRYLGAWLTILGRGQRGSQFRHKQLFLLDGFAGRGRYMKGQPGSPAIMFEEAARVAHADHVEDVLIRCSEPNATNFGILEEVCQGLQHDKVRISPSREKFQEIADRLVGYLAKEKTPPPTFVMVDPYGVRGVRLGTLRRLLDFRRLEVLLTFMVRDPARFLKEENYAEPLTALFGGEAWRECDDSENRPECLMLRFRKVVTPAIAKYAIPFLVFEDERRVPLYYLIHLTNNDLGMRKMKEVMVKKSGSMTFWPVTVEDPNQLGFEELQREQAPYPSLKERLREKYAGQSMTFIELLNDDYPHDIWVETQYRAALNGLAKRDPPGVDVSREGFTNSGKARTRGIKHEDTLTFLAAT